MAAEVSTVSTVWAVFSAIGGSLAGAFIGGSVSYFLQTKSLNAMKAQRDEDRFEVRKALGFSLFIKMSEVTSNINTVRKYFAEPIAQARTEGETELFWRFVLPPANVFARINFLPEEMAIVLSLDSDLFNRLMRWDEIHNGMLDVFELYRAKRYKFTDMLSADMTGYVGSSTFTEEEMARAAPRMAELDFIDQPIGRTNPH